MKKICCIIICLYTITSAYAQSAWTEKRLKEMSLEEKIGQLFMLAAYSNRDSTHEKEIADLVKNYHLGGLIMMQGSPQKHQNLVRNFQKVAKTPLLMAMDAEWGAAMRLDSVLRFPYQITLGALQDNLLIEKMGQLMAEECKNLGISVNFSPVCDVNNNINNPVINFRSFGENKFNVSEKSIALMRGMQNAGVLACAKHFPGHGDTDSDSHYTLPIILHDKKRLNNIELYPFKQLFAQNIASVMVAHLFIPNLDSTKNRASTLSPKIINDLLINELAYKGLIFTDALNMKGVSSFYKAGELEVLALEAGNDVLLFPENIPAAQKAILEAVKSGRISLERIEFSCKKILLAKEKLGLMNKDFSKEKNTQTSAFSSNEKKLLLRNIYENAQTVLKNTQNLVPFVPRKKGKFISIAIGGKKDNVFQRRLSDYDLFEHHILHENFSISAIDSLQKILKKSVQKADRIVVGVFIPSIKPGKNYGISKEMIEAVNRFSPKNSVVYLGNPYSLINFKQISKAKFLSLHYQDNEDTQDLAAQMLFGGVLAHGKLPVSVGAFKEGDGLILAKKIRFSYTLPEKFGIKSENLYTQVEKLAVEGIQAKAFPGCQIFVVKNGEVFFHETFGFHTYDSINKVKKRDIYDFASITKIAAATPALMKFYEKGKLKLDKGFDAYLKEYKKSNKAGIPLREMLTHQGRLTAWIPFWKSCKDSLGNWKPNTFSADSSANFPHFVVQNLYIHKDYAKTIYQKILESPLLPEKKYVYSDLGFYLYPKIIEKLSGEKFEDYIKNTFFKPLGAYSLTYNAYKHYPRERIVPTEYDSAFRKAWLHGTVDDEGAAMLEGVSGHAGLFGTAGDLAKMMQFFMNKGSYAGVQILKSSTLDTFTSCQFCEQGNRRALGFDKILLQYNEKDSYVAKSASKMSFGHSGFTGTFAWADPENGLLFVMLTNRVNPDRSHRNLMNLNLRPRIQQVFYDCLNYSPNLPIKNN